MGPDDLQRLVTNRVVESRPIEYKQALPGGAEADKKEFLGDVSAFATAVGGDLLYGVTEVRENNKPTGVPESIDGLGAVNTDLEMRRLDNILRGLPRVLPLPRPPPDSSIDRAFHQHRQQCLGLQPSTKRRSRVWSEWALATGWVARVAAHGAHVAEAKRLAVQQPRSTPLSVTRLANGRTTELAVPIRATLEALTDLSWGLEFRDPPTRNLTTQF